MPLRKLESDAYRCCGRDRCHSGGFLFRIMPPSWHPVPACAPRLCCRRAIHRCSNDGATAIPKSGPEIKNRCTLEDISGRKPAAIPNFTPSNQESLHPGGRFRSKTCSDSQIWPSNQESLHDEGCFRSKHCSDSQVYPLKSRITAR